MYKVVGKNQKVSSCTFKRKSGVSSECLGRYTRGILSPQELAKNRWQLYDWIVRENGNEIGAFETEQQDIAYRNL